MPASPARLLDHPGCEEDKVSVEGVARMSYPASSMVALSMEAVRARGWWMVTDWVTMETSTDDGGGANATRASWMVLTQLVVRSVMSFKAWGHVESDGKLTFHSVGWRRESWL